MSKFKVGDKVRCIDFEGNTGEDLEKLTNLHQIIDISHDYIKTDLYSRWSFSDRFELVVPEEPKKENMGIRLNNGKLRWRNFPMFLMEPVIRVGSFAEKREGNPNGKYETFNFLKGMQVNDCMDSLKRHLMKFESPYENDNDEESTESHLAHIAWNALVALHMLKTRPELDDRYKLPEKHVDDGSISEEERYELAKALQERGR